MRSKTTKSAGFSLIEVMIALGVLGISISAFVQFLSNTEREDKIEAYRNTQRFIGEKVALVLSNPEALAKSLAMVFPGNVALRSCVTAGDQCTAMNPASPQGFRLADPAQALGGTLAIAGPTDQTVRYDTKGELCASGPSCIFAAQVQFWGVCEVDRTQNPPRPRAVCEQPIDLMFKYRVTSLHPRVKEFPPPTSDPLGGVIMMRRSDLATATRQKCAPGMRQTGMDSKGNITCECVIQKLSPTGTPVVDSAGNPVCGAQKCPVVGGLPTVMVGFDPKGNIQCIDQNICATAIRNNDVATAQLCPCVKRDLRIKEESQCPAGFWMVNLTWGQCWAVQSKTKSGPDIVSCDEYIGVCCKLDAD